MIIQIGENNLFKNITITMFSAFATINGRIKVEETINECRYFKTSNLNNKLNEKN